ncbi:hypothetical protein ACSAGD_07950 [Paramicrobacterium sp. CJ85]|uniref:hypothetical protein n=1 Tax=Paramicrobacterium sp. CJ85 TaxID=3445355 RepID=UPI003F63178E
MTIQENSATVRLRLTARGRGVVTALATIPFVAALAFGSFHASSASASDTSADATFEYVTMLHGESLWQLAERIAPSADPRDVVAEIMQLNQLETSSIGAGERLAIPSQYDLPEE